MAKYLEDICYLAGWGLIIFATWQLSFIAGLYVAGAFCLITAILIGLGKLAKTRSIGRGHDHQQRD